MVDPMVNIMFSMCICREIKKPYTAGVLILTQYGNKIYCLGADAVMLVGVDLTMNINETLFNARRLLYVFSG